MQRKIQRLVKALTDGPEEDLPSVRQALTALERERIRLEDSIRAHRAATGASDDATLERTVETLLEALHDFRRVLEAGEPEERKEVVRCFVEGIRIEKTTRRAIVRWYRQPPVGSGTVKFEAPWGHHPNSVGFLHFSTVSRRCTLAPENRKIASNNRPKWQQNGNRN